MNYLLHIMARQGYALTFGLLFAEALGLPFPAAIALVAAGAAVAAHTLSFPAVLLASMAALLIGDSAPFWLGRYSGLGPVVFSLPPFDESRNLHSPFGRIVLQARQTHVGDRQVHTWDQHNGGAARGQHEDAVW